MKNVVKTDQAPGAIGPYSQGIQVGDMYFFSGQIPLVPSTGEMPEGIEAQAHQALKNVKGLLDSQGLSFSNVVKTTVFLDNMLSKKTVVLTTFENDNPWLSNNPFTFFKA